MTVPIYILLLISIISTGVEEGISSVIEQLTLPENPYALDPNRSCGPYCLTIINAMLGGGETYSNVVELCPPGPQGVNLYDLKRAAELMGLSPYGVKIRFRQLKQLPYLAILHRQSNETSDHFVALLGWDSERRKALLFSPPGRLEYAGEKAFENFSDVALLLWNTPISEPLIVESQCNSIVCGVLWGTICGLVTVLLYVLFIGQKLSRSSSSHLTALLLLSAVSSGCQGDQSEKTNGSSMLANNQSPVSDVSNASRDVDLGLLQVAEDLHHTFLIRNTTERPFLVTSIEKSCTCQTLGLSIGTEVPAGDVLHVPLTIPSKTSKGRLSGRVTIMTDSTDGKLNRIVLLLRGEVPDAIRAIPPKVVFGVVTQGATPTRTLRVESDVPGLIETFKDISSLREKTSPHLTQSKAGQLTFGISMLAGLPPGDFSDTLHLAFDHELYPSMYVQVDGRISGELQVIPSRLIFAGFVGDRFQVRRMRIISTRTRAPSIKRIECPDNISVDIMPDQPSDGIDLLVTAVQPDRSTGVATSDAKIFLTTAGGKTVSVRIEYSKY